jgi:ferredoxin-type protein NapH
VIVLFFAFGYRDGITNSSAIVWFLAGNLLYYASGIGLAYALQDNRAFCKYLCPITVPLKLTSRFSLLKVRADQDRCTGCAVCTRACPMDINIPHYTDAGQRVLSTECTLCQTCISACPTEALKLSFGLDMGGEEALRVRPAVEGAQSAVS